MLVGSSTPWAMTATSNIDDGWGPESACLSCTQASGPTLFQNVKVS
jgi:hypothetical protein